MITVYLNHNMNKFEVITPDNQALLHQATWIDLLSPTKEEEQLVENVIGLNVPTSEEMREIELSSRIYKDDGNLFMTATMIAQATSIEQKSDAVTFIMTDKQLITIRYIDPQSFKKFIAILQKNGLLSHDPMGLMIEFLEVAIDRLADILEIVGHTLDKYSQQVFRPSSPGNSDERVDYQSLMQQLGSSGDLNTKARESLMNFNRLITFMVQTAASKIDPEMQVRFMTASKDIASLSDHATFLSSKVNFLLDATLGMVNIEQNNIIKIFSVAAVIFLPPTLIASIYGMNFKAMPELSWHFGYLMAISFMLLSAWLPFRYFKRRKWL
ncbi:MAG: magnesium transporter CorA family protein [Gammaproteobacteria bacterium]|nr:magnesium transporter CorA family protein [Gammaproteobacteria bacterium]